jgi:carboxymethylenebutenolidase
MEGEERMSGKDISIQGADGNFGGYLASPASGHGPGVLVIQEIFGVNAVVRQICDAHAARGRFAFAPDLFWRLEPGIQITDKTQEEWGKALGLMQRFDVDKGMVDIQTSISYLRKVSGVSGKVGTVGYCLGGQLAFLAATRTDSDANVGYYGVNLQNRLNEASKMKKPLMLHIAAKDEGQSAGDDSCLSRDGPRLRARRRPALRQGQRRPCQHAYRHVLPPASRVNP